MNKKIVSLLIAALATLALTGCSGVRQFGQIETKCGTEKYYTIRDRGIVFGSNNTITAVKHADGSIDYLTSSSNPGVIAAVVSAGGNIGAAAVLRPARTTVNSSGSATGGSADSSSGSSAASGSHSDSTSTTDNSNNTTTTTGNKIPPGHLGTNPGRGHGVKAH